LFCTVATTPRRKSWKPRSSCSATATSRAAITTSSRISLHPCTAAQSRHGPAPRSLGACPALPAGAHRAGNLLRLRDPDPRGDSLGVPALPADAAHPRQALRAGPENTGPDLLQVRGRQPHRQSQAQHGDCPGLLQRQEGVRRLATETGAGQWAPPSRSRLVFSGSP